MFSGISFVFFTGIFYFSVFLCVFIPGISWCIVGNFPAIPGVINYTPPYFSSISSALWVFSWQKT